MTRASFPKPMVAAVVGVALFAAAPRRAEAQSAEAKAAAEALFEEGRRLAAAGRLAEACPKFAESNQLDAGVGTLLHLGACYEQTGQTASAWATFREAAALAARQADKRESLARQRAARLEPSLARVTVVVDDGALAGLEVRRDDERVPPAAYGVAVPVNPGEHVLRATAPGFVSWERRFAVRAGATPVTVRVPKLTPLPKGPSYWNAQRLVGTSLAGVGVLAFGAAVPFAVIAKDKYDQSNDAGCNPSTNECADLASLELRSQAIHSADWATGFVVSGAVCVAVGAALFFTAPSPRQAVGVAPLVGPGVAGGSLTGTF